VTARKILVGYDGTEPARRALAYAADLADGSGVTVASVVPSLAGPPFAGVADPLSEGWTASLLDEAEAFLRERDVEVTTVEPIGDAAEGLIRTAEAEHSDLIIVGTHGRNALERMLVGSVSARLARDAPCDVLVVR
jgi:nucleotide-binding universal stress UspA family protein